MNFLTKKGFYLKLIYLIVISILINTIYCRKTRHKKTSAKVSNIPLISEPVLDYGEDSPDKSSNDSSTDTDDNTPANNISDRVLPILGDIINSSDESKIVGGSTTHVKRWPWMAGIMRKGKTTPFCGGSLINSNTIVTAGHCVKGERPSTIKVRLGSTAVGSGSRESSSRELSVKDIRLHPRYKYPLNDIAVIKLNSNVNYGPYIQPISVEGSGSQLTGKPAVVTGWGTTSYGGRQSRQLKEVDLKVWDQSLCNRAIRQFPITNGMICAGAPNGQRKDACQGDSGGPLMTKSGSNGWRLIGVVSFGDKCAKPNMPGVYTRVNKYATWIKSQTG